MLFKKKKKRQNFQNYPYGERMYGQSLMNEKTLGKRPYAKEIGYPIDSTKLPHMNEAFLELLFRPSID